MCVSQFDPAKSVFTPISEVYFFILLPKQPRNSSLRPPKLRAQLRRDPTHPNNKNSITEVRVPKVTNVDK